MALDVDSVAPRHTMVYVWETLGLIRTDTNPMDRSLAYWWIQLPNTGLCFSLMANNIRGLL